MTSSAAPLCRKGLEDATRRWPSRSRISDGIMGDARHQKNKSDHNLGNAFDVTHDPSSGCDGAVIAAIAIRDPRVTYVIFNRRIWSRVHAAQGWRPYEGPGKNPHNHHCHVSIYAQSRNDLRPWGWAPGVHGAIAAQPAAPFPTPAAPPAHVPATSAWPVAASPHAPPTGAAPAAAGAPASALARPPAAHPYPGVLLRKGSRGVLVRRVQARLRELHWEVRVDGIYGPGTETMVERLQRRHSLVIDGEIGRKTWRVLFP
jgi:peptidoglycan hydrolase-like protein with peptidoglycan-binding domain